MFGLVAHRMRFSGSCSSFCAARSLCEGGQLLSELAQDILEKHKHAASAYMNIPIKNVSNLAKYASAVRVWLFVVVWLLVCLVCCVTQILQSPGTSFSDSRSHS